MPPKYERGILGVRKDPKKQMLFSFTAHRQGDGWPSDDSEDSDYCPDEEDGAHKPSSIRQKNKRAKRSQGGKTSKSQRLSSENNHVRPVSADPSHSCPELPWHVLLKIFTYVIGNDGCLPFVVRASRVCRQWRDVALTPSLWASADLSYGWVVSKEATLRWLCDHRFSKLRAVNLSTWKNLKNTGLVMLADNCPHLQSINLSHCTKIGAEGVRALIDKCTRLSQVDLSEVNTDAVAPATLRHLIEQRGSTLKSLNLSGNNLKAFQPVFNLIYTNCPLLEELYLNSVLLSTAVLAVHIERLQEGCPHLTVLQLSLTQVRAATATNLVKAASPGFPQLRDLYMSNDSKQSFMVTADDDFISRLLKSSPHLETLDLRGSSRVCCDTLRGLTTTSLRALHISFSSIARYTGIEVILAKWRHSLRDLDLSWNLYPAMSLDHAMRNLASDAQTSVLEKLNLSGTAITCDRVKTILDGCPKLQTLNLSSCRGLPRGMKCEFSGPLLDKLRGDIDKILEEEQEAAL